MSAKKIRNICILAHVDHGLKVFGLIVSIGKTTLADNLICYNGIISNKLAGKVRYLDSRPDEQLRQITMKASCISLVYKDKTAEDPKEANYLVNLIDSPGHVDFSSEVTSAVRLCDGALLVVDVVEGVCIQTTTVLRQAWAEKLKLVVVLNKIDRLITELKLSPLEAYEQIKRTLEQINAATGSLYVEHRTKQMDESHMRSKKEKLSQVSDDVSVEEMNLEDLADEDLYFSPEKGNVLFASAFDGWAFGLQHFSDLYVKKLGVKKEILEKTLWGDFYFHSKNKKVYPKNIGGKMNPMFVQFVLNNIWDVYNTIQSGDKQRIQKIVDSLKLSVNQKELMRDDAREVSKLVMSAWLPISDSVLNTVVKQLPSPIDAQKIRLKTLLAAPDTALTNPNISQAFQKLCQDVSECKATEDSSLYVYISKVFDKDQGEINFQNKISSKDNLVAFARIFSGTLKIGQEVHVLGPRFSPYEPSKHHVSMKIESLYVLRGRDLEVVNSISAGNVFGIGNIADFVIKTATLTNSLQVPVMSPSLSVSAPIVRVALETEDPREMPILLQGLKLLNQADPCVEVVIQENGEYVLVAAGELHLERCLKDLRDRFCHAKFLVSPPIVPFRETITAEPSVKFPSDLPSVWTANKMAQLRVRAIPLPSNLKDFLWKNSNRIKQKLQSVSSSSVTSTSSSLIDQNDGKSEVKDVSSAVPESASVEVEQNKVWDELYQEFQKAGKFWEENWNRLWSFGPKYNGANLLFNQIPEFSSINSNSGWIPVHQRTGTWKAQKESLKTQPKTGATSGMMSWKSKEEDVTSTTSSSLNFIPEADKISLINELDAAFISGFQMATATGPLCEEPMFGVAFFVLQVHFVMPSPSPGANSGDPGTSLLQGTALRKEFDRGGPFSGQLISCMKESCRRSFMAKSPRLLEPVFNCSLRVNQEYAGKLYSVLGKRRAKILQEDVKENSILEIEALLPVATSFGMSEELLTATSGSAASQMLFSHYAVLDYDPWGIYGITEEEMEEIAVTPKPEPTPDLNNVVKLEDDPWVKFCSTNNTVEVSDGLDMGTPESVHNTGRQYVVAVRKRKGLKVEENMIKNPDKQRTLSKKK